MPWTEVVIDLPMVLLAAGVAVGLVQAAALVAPILRDRAARRLLERELAQGPFDSATIERSTRYYIRPRFTNIDPSGEAEYRGILAAAREDLFSAIDRWLSDPHPQRHLLLLAESGIGKTSFVLNYFAYNRRRASRRRSDLVLVALGRHDADERIRAVANPQRKAIFLDAFDEDVLAIEDHRRRIRELMGLCEAFRAVVVTCRTQFFLRDEEIPQETGIVRVTPRGAGESGTYTFWKLYLAPFDDDDVARYLGRRYRFWQGRARRQAAAVVRLAPTLSLRPMLLAHVPELLEREQRIQHAFELYDVMVEAWLQRESRWADPKALRRIAELLAVDLYTKRQERRGEALPAHELAPYVASHGLPSLETWKLTGRSLLNRDAVGNYKFAHRSIMEHLFVERLYVHGDPACFGKELTDQMNEFLLARCRQAHPSLPWERLRPERLVVFGGPTTRKTRRSRDPEASQLAFLDALRGIASGKLSLEDLEWLVTKASLYEPVWIVDRGAVDGRVAQSGVVLRQGRLTHHASREGRGWPVTLWVGGEAGLVELSHEGTYVFGRYGFWRLDDRWAALLARSAGAGELEVWDRLPLTDPRLPFVLDLPKGPLCTLRRSAAASRPARE